MIAYNRVFHWDTSEIMDINALYTDACQDDKVAENRLFTHLTVSFRMFLQQRITNDSDVEEIVQDALVTIADKYREIVIEKSFAAWAYKVLNNKFLDYLKSKRVRKNKQGPMPEGEVAAADWVIDPALKDALLDCLRKINGANSNHARILNLHYQGFSTTEICRRCGLTPNYFYVTLSRARAMLEICLEKGDLK